MPARTLARAGAAAALALAAAVTVASAALIPIQIISIDEEIALGREAHEEFRAGVPHVSDRVVTAYVTGIGRRLAARAGGPHYPYSFTVANHREVNAFALPGGPIWIHRGAIQAATTEAQLAGVLAHEIAHIAERHTADQLTKSLIANGLLGLLGAMLGNDGGARAAQAGAQVLAGGYMMKFSRDDEREADRAGARLLRRAGWDAREMIAFMEMLRHRQGRDPGSVEMFLSSHPAPGERVQLLRTELKGVTGGRRDSAEFQRVKRQLARMPPAPPMSKR
jgi:predicted Zn-dependent protease